MTDRRRSLGFTLKHLGYFVATADYGSIKEASQRIGISQPSISSAIAHLEDEFAIQLFVRQHARGLVLTTSGRSFLVEAKQLLQQAQALYGCGDDVAATVRGPLSVGCLVTLAPMIVPELSQQYGAANPAVDLAVIEGNPRELIASLRTVDIDVAITYDLQIPDDIGFESLATLPPYVLVDKNHRLRRSNEVKLAELADEPMILLDLPYSRQYFLALFQSHGLQPKVHARSSNQEVVRTMVANGFGYTIANVRPKNLTARDGRELLSLHLDGNHQPMTIGIATLRLARKPPVLVSFEQHCREVINQKNVPGMQLD